MVDHEPVWGRSVCQAGPLAPVMEELVGWLDAQGYAATTQRNLVRAAGRLDSWMLAENVRLVDVDRSSLARLVREDNERHPEHVSANENVSAVLRFLEETGLVKAAKAARAAPRPAQRCVLEWLRFLEVDQGQGASWVAKAGKVGESFLRLIESPRGELVWERVDVTMANDFLRGAVDGYSSSTAQSTAALLRGLLTWAAGNGWIDDGIARGVLSPRRIRLGLPKALSAHQVAALKGAVVSLGADWCRSC